jgi:hypothetical protein
MLPRVREQARQATARTPVVISTDQRGVIYKLTYLNSNHDETRTAVGTDLCVCPPGTCTSRLGFGIG